MSKFNTKTAGLKTTNLAGGQAYSQSAELELASILLTSFGQDKFYSSDQQVLERLRGLIHNCDKRFVAQAAVYARTKFGMRTITHVVASELARYISKEEWAKDFYSSVIYRPDDMMEILAYHTTVNGKITNQMKKGFAKAFDKFDQYSLAKYRGEGKQFKLIDVVNLVHPTPLEKNKKALEALVKSELKSFDTWESKLTKAGQLSNDQQEKAEFKREAWIELIKEKKIGYFALLRNLRNIIEQAPGILTEALALLTDENLINKSLVLPFRYLTAFEEVQKMPSSKELRQVVSALNAAVDISLKNVPVFAGDTLVVLDVSGSMAMNSLGSKSPHVIGSLFSAILIKSNNSDFIVFADNAKYQNVNPADSTLTISNQLRFASGGTNFHSIFQTANKKYDRIIILSDMQGWVGENTPTKTFNEYKKRTGANPYIYSFDLQGYGTMQFPEQNVFAITGFSEKVFDIMKLMEDDKKAFINEIKKINF